MMIPHLASPLPACPPACFCLQLTEVEDDDETLLSQILEDGTSISRWNSAILGSDVKAKVRSSIKAPHSHPCTH